MNAALSFIFTSASTALPRTALLAAMIALVATPAAAAQRKYGTVSFERVELVGNFNADITVATGAGVIADGETEALERLDVDVNNGTLTIREKRLTNERGASNRTSRPVILTIRATGLKQVGLAGNGRVTVTGLHDQNAALFLRGNGEISATGINVASASAMIDGAGRIMMSGRAQSLTAALKGAASLDAAAFVVRDLDVNAQGTGRGSFNATRRASVTATGLGVIDVTGTAACTVKNTGNGEVYCGK